MKPDSINIGKTSVKIVNRYYCLSDIISDYNKRFKKNRSHSDFKRLDFLSDACKLLNQFHKCKTFNESSVFSFHKNPATGKANVFGHPLLFSKYIIWCFPDKHIQAREILKSYLSESTAGMFAEYIKIVDETYDNAHTKFEPIEFFREFYLIYKYSQDMKNFNEFLDLNSIMIKQGISFKSRYVTITKFFNK